MNLSYIPSTGILESNPESEFEGNTSRKKKIEEGNRADSRVL